jgi:hypothetical protein
MKIPPFLLAAALAFWGWRSGNYLPAAVLAVLAEAPRLIALRFELRHADFARVADLCGTVFVALVVWLLVTIEPPRVARAVLTSLLWLPALLAPVLLAQRISGSGRVPLSALFRYLRKLRERDPSIPDPPVDVAGVYFAVCLVAASIPNQRDEWFYGGVVLLVAWALAAIRPKHAALAVWAGAVIASAGIGFAAHRGLGELQARFEDWIGEWQLRGIAADPYRSSTDLGTVGRLKMIDSILLRVYANPEDVPRIKLLHRASFTALHGTTWIARNAPMRPLEPQADGTTWPISPGKSERAVRIVTQLENGKALLALPAGTVRISGMAAAAVQRNAFGAVQAELGGDWAPYVVELGGLTGEYAPPGADDRLLPAAERVEFERLADELNLSRVKPIEAMKRVRDHLATFSYATYREAPVPQGSTALGDFLRRSKSGHCEYFAAAATLLLRAGGVPARYATGFALTEYSPLEEAYVVRARHAHAWTRAYVDGNWVELDTTPPSWVEEEERGKPAWQALADLARWAGFRWSQRGALQGGAEWYFVLALLVGVFAWRMLRGKLVERTAVTSMDLPSIRRGGDSEFFSIEKALAGRFGTRSHGENLAAWLQRAAAPFDTRIKEQLARALLLHARYRFDPAGLSADEREALRAHCLALARTLH